MIELTAMLADRYRIERELGSGGMATVYLAHDLKHDRKVAVKILKPELGAVLGAERFLAEIKVTANLHHPNLLPLFDSGATPGLLFYVMPYVEGETLRSRLDRETQLPVDDVVRLTTLIAGALDYAHARGIVHRDLKPENILLQAGQPVVADFGIALAVAQAGGSRITETGLSLGTPHYMSPEQATPDAVVDARSDQYALGSVTYEMLTGEPPHTGATSQAIIARLMTEKPRSVRATRSTVPVAVDRAIERVLAKTPADRFSSCGAFAKALVTERPAESRVGMSGRRRLMLAGAGALATLVLIAWLTLGRKNQSPAASVPPGPKSIAVLPTAAIQRIAVLPMDNQTGDTAQRFFADGMTREVIGVLSDVGVRVLGYRAVAAYRGSTLPVTQIAKELGVDAVVAGAVTRAGDVVQVSAELTDPRTDEALWSRTFSRPAADVLALQREMAGEIARGIRARLTSDQERAFGDARPVNPQAYAQYLLGQEQVNLRTPEGIQRSITYLNRSLALDSTFAPAWGTLALAYAFGIFYRVIPPDSARAAIERASARALALDDRLGDALIARGMMHFLLDWDFTKAQEELGRGMGRNPTTLAQAFYVFFPWETGQFEVASAIGKRLVDVEPTTAQWRSDMSWNRWSAGDTAAARAYASQAIAADSTFGEPYMILAFMGADGGDIPAARRAVARASVLLGADYSFREMIDGYVKAKSSDTAGARRVLRAMDKDPRLAQRALILSALGDRDSMYVMFEHAIDAKDPDAIWFLNAVPSLRPLRHEPRYQRLLERMGLPKEWRQ